MKRSAFKAVRGGSALILVLWLVIVMTLVATVTARISRLDGTVSQMASERIRCRWAARAGIETAVALLLMEDRSTDTLLDIWANNPQQLDGVDLEGAAFRVSVTDESGKLDLNTATAAQLAALDLVTAEICDSILDWRDSDDDPQPSGAEEGYYRNLPRAYSCRNDRFQSVRELLRVRGMDPETLYGSEELSASGYTPLIDLLTCWSAQANTDAESNARININSANSSQLRNLPLSGDQVQWIESHRQFGTLAELTDENKQAAGGNDRGQNQGQGSRDQSQNQGQSQSREQRSGRSGNSNGGSSGRSSGNSSGRSSGSQGGSNSQSQSSQQSQGRPLDSAALASIADRVSVSDQTPVTGKLNVNTASVEVLEAFFEGNRELAQNMAAARQLRENGFESFEDVRGVQGMTDEIFLRTIDSMALRSSVFRIASTGISAATGQTLRIEAIIDRDRDSGRVLYWRED
jgi:type II secretory pathway component PulK